MQILLSTADRLTMQLLLATLTDSGARLDVAETENEFVRKCLGGAYQLVITQFDAPFLNGYDLLPAFIRAQRGTAPFVLRKRDRTGNSDAFRRGQAAQKSR